MAAEAIAVTAALVIAMIAASLLVARRLPEGLVPVHFDIRGKPDRFGSRWVALGILPATYPLVCLAMAAGSWIAAPGTPEQDSELLTGAIVGGAGVLAAHLFILWLLLRWARSA